MGVGIDMQEMKQFIDSRIFTNEHIPYSEIDNVTFSRGAQNALSLGCDMDGADLLADIPDISYLDRIAEHLAAHGYSQALIDALFFENAYRFAQKHF